LIGLTLADIAEITGGRLRGADPDTPVTGTIEFDSRRVTRGGLFLAFPGEHADGHDFVGQAIASCEPNTPTCALPTFSTTLIRGGAMSVR